MKKVYFYIIQGRKQGVEESSLENTEFNKRVYVAKFLFSIEKNTGRYIFLTNFISDQVVIAHSNMLKNSLIDFDEIEGGFFIVDKNDCCFMDINEDLSPMILKFMKYLKERGLEVK